MAVAPSQTRTINKALALLGSADRIANITDGTPAASTALALWEDARDSVLAAHPWHFAKRRAQLAADATAPEFGWTYRYLLPPDCLRWLPPGIRDEDYFAGEIEDRYILSDQVAPLNIRYIARIEDMLAWSTGFIEALACKLAWEMAEPITGGLEGVADRMRSKYETAIGEAAKQNGMAAGSRARLVEEGSCWNIARHRSR